MEVVRNKAILREWAESEVKSRENKGKKSGRFGKEGQEEGEEIEKWKTVVDGLGFACQVWFWLLRVSNARLWGQY